MPAKPEARYGAEAGDYESDAPEEGTPPPVSRHDILSEPLMHSTPQTKGTAEQSELHYDMRTKTRQNVKHDLRDTPTVDFADMVKVIMYRKTRSNFFDDAPDKIQKDFQSQKENIDAEYDKILGDAIELCNADLNMPRKVADRTPTQLLCQNIKADMKKYCEATTEKQRYVPFVNLLNRILSIEEEDPQVIFVVNDPMIVQSDHLPAKSKRKPDIIKVSLKTFKRWLQLPDNTNFDTCRIRAGTGMIKIFGKPYWIDVEQFWELKLGRILADLATKEKLKFDREACSTKGSVPSKGYSTALSGNIVGAESLAPKRKRENAEEDAESGKKPRKKPRAAGGQIIPPPGEVPAVDDDVQCGYYAMERFRAAWQISHVSGIFLKANLLNLLWYDPQGCIQSSRIDIVRQLPLLVLLVKLQQRSDRWSGLKDTTLPPNYRMEDKCAPRFQLVGRMTSCADLTTEKVEADSAAGVSGAREANRYFKSSWPEDDRLKEADIINLAKCRVYQFLPRAFQQFVLNHLPEVHVTLLLHDTRTAIIRALLDLPTRGSRTQYLMISKKLSSVRTIVHDDRSFKRVLVEIIRAHRLLWVLGIAHSDVSFRNLMHDGNNGILNDFDLASIMEPGETSPPMIGHRRTGTPMFMPLELLTVSGVTGLVPRVYCHELESFAWVLLYAALCVVNGEESMDVSPFCDWVGLTSTELGSRKSAFLLMGADNISRLVKDPYQQVLLSTFQVWRGLLNKREDAIYSRTTPSLPSDESLLTDVLAALGFSYAEWIDFKISPKSTLLNPSMAAGRTIIAEDLVEDPSTTSALAVGTVAGSSGQSQGADDQIYV